LAITYGTSDLRNDCPLSRRGNGGGIVCFILLHLGVDVLSLLCHIVIIGTNKGVRPMTDFLETQDSLQAAYKRGKRFVIRVEAMGVSTSFDDMIADDMGHAVTLSLNAINKLDAKSVAVYRILPNGKRNFVRFYDYQDAA
jgi:hypothetical protein